MGNSEDDLNINLGLARGSTEADRQRYRDHVRAGDMYQDGYSSPPGGLAILLGLFNRVRRHSAPRRTSSQPHRLRGAIVGALLGAALCHFIEKPVPQGAILGAVAGALLREIALLAIIAVIVYAIRGFSPTKQPEPAPAVEVR